MKPATFWNLMQHRLLVCYRCFGRTYRSHFRGSSSLLDPRRR